VVAGIHPQMERCGVRCIISIGLMVLMTLFFYVTYKEDNYITAIKVETASLQSLSCMPDHDSFKCMMYYMINETGETYNDQWHANAIRERLGNILLCTAEDGFKRQCRPYPWFVMSMMYVFVMAMAGSFPYVLFKF